MKAICQIGCLLFLLQIIYSCEAEESAMDNVVLKPVVISVDQTVACVGDSFLLKVEEFANKNGQTISANDYTWRIVGKNNHHSVEVTDDQPEYMWIPTSPGEYLIEVTLDYDSHGMLNAEYSESIKVNPCVVNSCDHIGGLYIGVYDEFKSIYIEINKLGENQIEIESLLDIVYPSPKFDGKIVDDRFVLNYYSCIDCPGLPSPGGNPRYYTSTVDGYGQCINEGDSIVLYIDYTQTGFLASEFKDNIYLKKVD